MHFLMLQMKDVNARLERIEPKVSLSDGVVTRFVPVETKSVNPGHKRGSPRAKSVPRETPFYGGESLLASNLSSKFILFSCIH